MSTILSENLVVELANIHKIGNEEYCRVSFKVIIENHPIYVSYTCTKSANGEVEYYLTTEVVAFDNNLNRTKYSLLSSTYTQRVDVYYAHNNINNASYYFNDPKFKQTIDYVVGLFKDCSIEIVGTLLTEKVKFLYNKSKHTKSYPAFVREILNAVNKQSQITTNEK